MPYMLDVRDLQAENLQALSPGALAMVAEQMLLRIDEQGRLKSRSAWR